jgi:hypothetical protein
MVPRARLELAWPEGSPGFEPGTSTVAPPGRGGRRGEIRTRNARLLGAPPLPLGYATRWSCGRDSNPHWRPSQDRASTEVGLPQDDGARGRIRTGTARRLGPSPLPRLGYASRWSRASESNRAASECGTEGVTSFLALGIDGADGRTRTSRAAAYGAALRPALVGVVVEPRRARLGGAPPAPPGEACGDLPASRTPCRELRRLAPRSAGRPVNGAP